MPHQAVHLAIPIMLSLSHLSSTASAWFAQTDGKDWLLVALTPLFLLTVAIEWLRLKGRGLHDWRDTLDSMNLGGIYTLVDLAIFVALVLPAMNGVYQYRLNTIAITPWHFAALYIGVEFCYYWFHRASHRIRWFWCAHVVHHGSEYMNFTTAMRQSWLYSLAGNWLFYLPMVLIGFEPRWVMFALACNLGYQFFVHTQWIKQLPAPVEWLFNTPSHHRAHHGRNPHYLDRNFGGTFIVFDRLFGTFEPEVEAVDYGLVRQVHSHNPVWLTIHEWVAMARDMAQPGAWTQRLKHIWAPPEWARNNTTQDNRAHASERPPRPHGSTRP